MSFKVTRIDHVGIAVKDLEAAKKFYTEILGLKDSGEETVDEQKVKVTFSHMYPLHTEQTEKVEGVHKANGTNGNKATVCILY